MLTLLPHSSTMVGVVLTAQTTTIAYVMYTKILVIVKDLVLYPEAPSNGFQKVNVDVDFGI